MWVIIADDLFFNCQIFLIQHYVLYTGAVRKEEGPPQEERGLLSDSEEEPALPT